MKTKILLSLVLAGFSFSSLARTAAVRTAPAPAPPTKAEKTRSGVNNGSNAFGQGVPLRGTPNCSGICVVQAQSVLSEQAVRNLNKTNTLIRDELLSQLLQVNQSLVSSGEGQGKVIDPVGSFSLTKGAIEKTVKKNNIVERQMTALTSAAKRATIENWTTEEKANFQKFIKGLVDGVSPKEAAQLARVVDFC